MVLQSNFDITSDKKLKVELFIFYYTSSIVLLDDFLHTTEKRLRRKIKPWASIIIVYDQYL